MVQLKLIIPFCQVAAKRSEARRIVTDDQFVVPETVDEIDDCLASIFKNTKTDSSGGVNYSDEEDDKVRKVNPMYRIIGYLFVFVFALLLLYNIIKSLLSV